MPGKHCKWGLCKSDSRYNESLAFFPFPKPCKDYNLLRKDSTLLIHHSEDSCEQCSNAKLWLKSCNLKDFNDIAQITKHSYICGLHFVDEKPTTTHPNPIDARTNKVCCIIFALL